MSARRAIAACAAFGGLHAALVLSLVWRFPPFNDEGIYASWTEIVERDPSQRFMPLAGGKEPLLEWFGAIFVRLGLEPLTAVRLISLLAGVGIVLLIAILGWWLGGPRVGVVGAAFASVSPFLVVYSALGIYESLATLLVLAALLLQVSLARSLRLDVAFGLGIVLGLAVLTKQSTAIALALWPLSLVCLDWSAARRWRRVLRIGALAAFAMMLAAAIGSLLYLTDFHDELVRARTEQYPVHSASEALARPVHWLRVNDELVGVLVAYLSVLVIVAAGLGIIAGARRASRLTVVVVVWGLAPLVSALFLADIPFPRYVHVVAPPVIALAALGVVATAERVGERWPKTVRGLPVTSLAVVALVVGWPAFVTARMVAEPLAVRYPGLDDGQYITGWGAGTGWKAVARELRSRAGNGPLTVMLGPRANDWLGLTMRDDARFQFVRYDSEEAQDAVLAVQNFDPLPDREPGLGWQFVASMPRPRHGVPLRMYVSGVRIGAKFASTPTELRAALAWDDARYDEYVHSHPAVRRWVEAYTRAYTD